MEQAMTFAATNEPGTCLWCGEKLRKKRRYQHEWDDKNQKHLRIPDGYHYDGVPGYMGNGYFCTMTCAYRFACASAKHGIRLSPKEKTNA